MVSRRTGSAGGSGKEDTYGEGNCFRKMNLLFLLFSMHSAGFASIFVISWIWLANRESFDEDHTSSCICWP